MILRVFPRRTSMTPDDEYVRIGEPDLFLPDNITEVYVSVLFTWDIDEGYRTARAWANIAPTKIDGVALGVCPGDFEPGKFLKTGCVITSRGCPNKCWFCDVWKREGERIRELPICEGYNVLDSNLLACSDTHINSVFEMLSKQKQTVKFTGGLEAARLKDWHIDRLVSLPRKPFIFLAYDSDDDEEPLRNAFFRLYEAGFRRHDLGCYCLIGYPGDIFDFAEDRLCKIRDLGMVPYAMIYRDRKGYLNPDWVRFRRAWFNPQTIFRCKKGEANG